ncbi:cellulase family glycosylhydrolase [Streptomyces sp. JH002]|uniref:cellulase family glycosylhydrolase n=1 Tax=Streptomyces sp. JH002 TaxID=2763259 RepID=UPI003D805EE4
MLGTAKKLLRTLTALAIPLTLLAGPASAARAEDPTPRPAADAIQWLSVDGNQIRDEDGRPVTLRGVSVLAPRHNAECADCNPKPISELIDMSVDAAGGGWHSKVLRLPVTEWAPNDSLPLAENFARHVDPYVQQAIDLGIYVIVDFHRVQNYGDGNGGVPQSIVKEFWDYVAPRYAGVPNVIFEVYNEPLAPTNWATWKSYITPVVDSIRQVAPDNLILMGSPNWSTMVNEAAADPIDDANTAYVYHLYPNQGPSSVANLDQKFGNASRSIPVILTEFGWNPAGEFTDPAVTQGTTKCWGNGLRNYLDERPWISWTAWVFDNYWKPQMFDKNWNLLGGDHQGQFVKDWLGQLKDHNQPGTDNPPGAGDDLGVPPSRTGIVVDNTSPGYSDSGDWTTADTAHGFHGIDYKHDGSGTASAKTATFTPDLPASGRYNVYLWWSPNSNRTAAAPVSITHAGGTAALTVDQRTGGCDWGLLGTYDFTAGAGQKLTLSADSPGYTIADAVLFEPADGTDPGTGEELLVNGDFAAGLDPWYSIGGATPGTPAGGELCTAVAGGTTQTWDALIGQDNIPLTSGGQYALSFTASTSAPAAHTVRAAVESTDFPHPTQLDAYPRLTGEGQRYTYVFSPTDSLDAARLRFQLGGQAQPYTFCLAEASLTRRN